MINVVWHGDLVRKLKHRIELFEMRTLHTLLRISWVESVSNDKVLRRARVVRELTTEHRKMIPKLVLQA